MGISAGTLGFAPSGLVLVKKQTLSGTTTQVDNCFTTEFDSYKVVFSSLTSSTVDFITMRLVTGTTPNQTSNYYSSGLQVNTSGTVTGISGGGAISYWTTHVVSATTASGGSIDIYNPKQSVATSFVGQGVDTRTDGAPHRTGGGFFNGTTSFDGMWISTVNGTYTLGGTVRVYGYRN